MQYRPQSDLSPTETAERVETTLAEHDVVLFMKGSKASPQCDLLDTLAERGELEARLG